MRPNATTADLVDSLRAFVASADGDTPSTAPEVRDSPGARSAAAAGQPQGRRAGRSRRDTLPDDHQVAVDLAEQLLGVLVQATLRSSRMTPGEKSAARSGGRRIDVAGRWGAA